MKKILLILIVFLNACLVQAQQGQTFGATAKVLSVDEVNKLNGTPQTTINGKPYSQYKAEQAALQQQQAANNKMATPIGNNITNSNGKAPVMNSVPAIDPNQSKQSTTITPAAKPISAVPATKAAVTQTEVASPAIQMIPVGTLKNSVASQAPVTTAAKSVDATSATSGTLIPVTGLTLANGTTTEQVTTTPVVTAPQTIGTAKPAQTPVEIPASVITPASKVPVASSQSTEKTKGKN